MLKKTLGCISGKMQMSPVSRQMLHARMGGKNAKRSPKTFRFWKARSSSRGRSRRRPAVHSELAHFQLWPLVPLSCRAPSHLGNFTGENCPFSQGTTNPHSMYDLTFFKATFGYFLSGDIPLFFQHNAINIAKIPIPMSVFRVFVER